MTAPTAVLVDGTSTLGPVIRQRRKSQELRIDDTAAQVGVSVDLLSRLENGQGSVRLDKILSVLDGLGLTLMVLPKDHIWARETRFAAARAAADVGE